MSRTLALLALAGFILLPLAQAVILSLTATLPTETAAEGSLGLMNYRNVLAAPELRAALIWFVRNHLARGFTLRT